MTAPRHLELHTSLTFTPAAVVVRVGWWGALGEVGKLVFAVAIGAAAGMIVSSTLVLAAGPWIAGGAAVGLLISGSVVARLRWCVPGRVLLRISREGELASEGERLVVGAETVRGVEASVEHHHLVRRRYDFVFVRLHRANGERLVIYRAPALFASKARRYARKLEAWLDATRVG